MNAANTEELQSGVQAEFAPLTPSLDANEASWNGMQSYFLGLNHPVASVGTISIGDIVNDFSISPTIGPIQMPGIQATEVYDLLEFRMIQREQLDRIEKNFVLEDRLRLLEFLKRNILLTQVLLEAVPHLRESFGTDVPLILRFSWEDESSRTVYGIVPWTGALVNARTALDRFDVAWWRKNSYRTGGRIVFDYELA